MPELPIHESHGSAADDTEFG
eukprot:COSAG01_NODE_60385_length_295_cov_0.739796_2_plen_20_part_01